MAKSNVKLLKIVNPILAILFFGQAFSGIFHDIIPYGIFAKAHGSVGYLLAAAAIAHIVLNWSWIKVNFLKSRSK